MDMIIQVLMFPLVLPIFMYIIFLEKRKEKEKKEKIKNTVSPKYGIYFEHFPSENELRTGKRKGRKHG